MPGRSGVSPCQVSRPAFGLREPRNPVARHTEVLTDARMVIGFHGPVASIASATTRCPSRLRWTRSRTKSFSRLVHRGDDAGLVGEGGDDRDEGDRDDEERDPDRHVVSPLNPAGRRTAPGKSRLGRGRLRRAACLTSVQKEAAMDLFLVHAYQDEEYASGLEDTLSGRGLVVGEPLSLWPGQRLLPPIDQRLHDARRAIVIISKAFLASRGPVRNWTGSRPEAGSWHPPGHHRGGRGRTFLRARSRRVPRLPVRAAGLPAPCRGGDRVVRNSRSRDGDLVRTPTSLTPGTNRPCAGATRCVGGDGRPCREHAGQRPRERFGEVYRASRVSRTLK